MKPYEELETSQPKRSYHLFLPMGAIWFGILALTINLVMLSSSVFGWRYVTRRAPMGPQGEWVDTGKRDRIELHNFWETGGGTWSMGQTFIVPSLGVATLGLLLTFGSLFIPRRKWPYIALGGALNCAAWLLPLALEKLYR